jgi:hypothetical protein
MDHAVNQGFRKAIRMEMDFLFRKGKDPFFPFYFKTFGGVSFLASEEARTSRLNPYVKGLTF